MFRQRRYKMPELSANCGNRSSEVFARLFYFIAKMQMQKLQVKCSLDTSPVITLLCKIKGPC